LSCVNIGGRDEEISQGDGAKSTLGSVKDFYCWLFKIIDGQNGYDMPHLLQVIVF